MKFSFEVGEREKHIVSFSFNNFVGTLSILVDGAKLLGDVRVFSLSLTKAYDFRVGTEEIHYVRIEKTRKLFLSGFRKSTYKVFIDGTLLKEYVGQ